MNLKKNDIINIEITDLGINGEGIGKFDNFTFFIENALPNEIIKAKILKLKKNYGYAKILEIVKPSEKRINPNCQYFFKCGGCSLQHLEYNEQLKIKTLKVKNNIKRIGQIDNFNLLETIGMENPFNYRNKASFPTNYTNILNIGFYSKRSHNIINIDKCIINFDLTEKILQNFRNLIEKYKISVYNENDNTGIFKHLITRSSKNKQEIIICIVLNSNNIENSLKQKIVDEFKNISAIVGIVLNYNPKNTNVILSHNCETIYGKDYIIDYINDLKFKISILSFYQVNPIQTNILYETALKFANLTGNEIVFDAYCGIGTISLFLAKNSKKVYGIEIVEEAIKDAKQNALQNNIFNTEFFVGKSEEVIPKLVDKKIVPDVVVVDPPRKGCDKALLECLVKTKIKKIVYISCDSATFARDLNYLYKNGYKLDIVQPVDMFCMTNHIELVALISLY